MKSVYLIRGRCGCYSNYSTWIVCAFARKSDAENFIGKISQWWKDYKPKLKTAQERYFKSAKGKRPQISNPFDDNHSDEDTDWKIEVVDFHTSEFKVAGGEG